MRKNYLILTFIALTLNSCEQRANQTSEEDSITIATTLATQTKGTMVQTESQMGSMAIYCAHTADQKWSESTTFDKLSNKRLDYNSSTESWEWELQAPSWENNSITDRYTFLAYSPFGDSQNGITPSIENGALVIDYTIPENCSYQPDLMLAIPRKDIYPPMGGTVSLNFQHALAAISFSVKGESSYSITNIAIKNVVSSGTVTISDSGVVAWDLSSSSSDVEYDATINSTAQPNLETSTPLTLESGYLMMIPQETNGVEIIATVYDSTSRQSQEVLFALTEDQLWEAGKNYTYIVNIGENYDYTIEGTSNCYMLHPNGEEQVFYIPVEGRINCFWRDYADDNMTYEDMLGSLDVWSASILWYDVEGSMDGFFAERVTSGFSPSQDVTADSSPDFTTIGTNSAMKITLPSQISEGNILLAVELNGQILWSWHLWITSYDPDTIVQRATAQQGRYIYKRRWSEGEVHRYDDTNLWSGLYQDMFIMDRNLGARSIDFESDGSGVLHYQFGRKDPFPVTSSTATTIEDAKVSFAQATENPTTFYTQQNRPFCWCLEGVESTNQYLWNDESVANDPNTLGKSIFDPSPLGWKVPRLGTFTILDNTNCQYDSDQNAIFYNDEIKFPMSGYRSNKNGTVKDFSTQGNLRLSTVIDDSFAYNLVYEQSIDGDTDNTRSDGFCVRCVTY